jgi:glycosyltransferase involved in cell wall biosynthesis
LSAARGSATDHWKRTLTEYPGSSSRLVHLRGHNANVWDLRPLETLAPEFESEVLVTGSNLHDLNGLSMRQVAVATPRDKLPPGRAAGAAAYAIGERYLGLEGHLRGAAIVHGAELAMWFTAQAARLKPTLGFKLVATAWETLPFGATYRWPRERRSREDTLHAVDRWLAATERAKDALLLEGVPADRITVSSPGIDLERFGAARARRPPDGGGYVLSAGRLVWEKGHQDVIRAVAALRDPATQLLIVGDGPERRKLEHHARELGVNATFRSTVPYDEMPDIYAGARAMVLGSLPTKGWEEQFGMVLIEALAAGTRVIATTTGAIPEVVADSATLVAPGGWKAMAEALLHPEDRPPPDLARYSAEAAAERVRGVYREVLGA